MKETKTSNKSNNGFRMFPQNVWFGIYTAVSGFLPFWLMKFPGIVSAVNFWLLSVHLMISPITFLSLLVVCQWLLVSLVRKLVPMLTKKQAPTFVSMVKNILWVFSIGVMPFYGGIYFPFFLSVPVVVCCSLLSVLPLLRVVFYANKKLKNIVFRSFVLLGISAALMAYSISFSLAFCGLISFFAVVLKWASRSLDPEKKIEISLPKKPRVYQYEIYIDRVNEDVQEIKKPDHRKIINSEGLIMIMLGVLLCVGPFALNGNMIFISGVNLMGAIVLFYGVFIFWREGGLQKKFNQLQKKFNQWREREDRYKTVVRAFAASQKPCYEDGLEGIESDFPELFDSDEEGEVLKKQSVGSQSCGNDSNSGVVLLEGGATLHEDLHGGKINSAFPQENVQIFDRCVGSGRVNAAIPEKRTVYSWLFEGNDSREQVEACLQHIKSGGLTSLNK